MNLKTELERWKKGWRALWLYRKCVRPGYLCFDIGANHGSRSMIFILLGAKTIAVEPNPNLTGLLRRFPRVTVEHCAVSDEPGTKTFLINANDQISSLNPEWREKWPEHPEWRETKVECVTLDLLIGKHGLPDFCKIDVEGYEPAVLRGLSRPIPRLSFEVAPDFRANAEECVNRLLKIGNYEFNFAAGDDFRFLSPTWVDGQQVLSLMREAGDIYARLSAGRAV